MTGAIALFTTLFVVITWCHASREKERGRNVGRVLWCQNRTTPFDVNVLLKQRPLHKYSVWLGLHQDTWCYCWGAVVGREEEGGGNET